MVATLSTVRPGHVPSGASNRGRALTVRIDQFSTLFDLKLFNEAWKFYCEVFEEINTLAVNRHLLTSVEFSGVMWESRIIKYVARDEAGNLVGMSVMTNHLDKWPLISPQYFQRHYPFFWRREAIWYVGFVGAKPGTKGVFPALLEAMLKPVQESDGMVVVDFCTENVQMKDLPRRTSFILNNLNPKTQHTHLDSQEFHAWRFDGGGW